MNDERIRYGKVKWFKEQGVGYVEDMEERAYFFDKDAIQGLHMADIMESGMRVKFRVISKTGEDVCAEVWVVD